MRKIHRYTITHHNAKGIKTLERRVAWLRPISALENKELMPYAASHKGLITRNVARGSVYIQHEEGYTHITPIYG
jgi:hypothetical protein